MDVIELTGPNRAVSLFGVKLVGVTLENGAKLLFTLGFVAVLLLGVRAIRFIVRRVLGGRAHVRAEFWTRQGIHLLAAVLLFFGVVSIWFDDPTRLTTALGLITAGLAFALQKLIAALAGYFVLLRGKTFNVGDRIVMGGVRGDVIALDFTQTTILEMGQPPPVERDEPAMWVKSRQYTGRIVTVSNSKIFDEPVYNYSREFPFLWEEISLPLRIDAERDVVERILLEAAQRYSVPATELGADALREMQRRYFMPTPDVTPRVYVRIADSVMEMTLRFLSRDHGGRELVDAISRHIVRELASSGVTLAPSTVEIVGTPLDSPPPAQPRYVDPAPGRNAAASE